MGSALSCTGACELSQWVVDVTKISIRAESSVSVCCHRPAVTKTQENDNKKCRAKKKKSDQRDKEGQGQ